MDENEDQKEEKSSGDRLKPMTTFQEPLSAVSLWRFDARWVTALICLSRGISVQPLDRAIRSFARNRGRSL